jgi:hypothetical protein
MIKIGAPKPDFQLISGQILNNLDVPEACFVSEDETN